MIQRRRKQFSLSLLSIVSYQLLYILLTSSIQQPVDPAKAHQLHQSHLNQQNLQQQLKIGHLKQQQQQQQEPSRCKILIDTTNSIDNKPYDNKPDQVISASAQQKAQKSVACSSGFLLGASAGQIKTNSNSLNRLAQLEATSWLDERQEAGAGNFKQHANELPSESKHNSKRRQLNDQNEHQQHHHRRSHRNHNHKSRFRRHQQHEAAGSTRSANESGRKRRQQAQSSPIYDSADYTDRPLVLTNKGFVRGITQKTVTGKFVDTFLGIPYAQAPVGKYRFRHPQAIQAWPAELDASKLSNSCPQINDTFFGANFPGTSIWNANTPIHEDCLYLNVWSPFGVANATIAAPLNATNSNKQDQINPSHMNPNKSGSHKAPKRPVLVWIFGGGFTSGTSSLSLYEGGLMASEEDIIVVSMNYRVAALGFLYLGRAEAPGNAGLFDQVMALQWISDNIDQFGGDPKRVTVFGESAGAVSASLHLLSPISRNLFQQAILQSASATAPWAIKDTREIFLNGIQLANHLGCGQAAVNNNLSDINLEPSLTNGELDSILQCMLKVDANELVKYEVGQSRTILKFPFVPIVDGSFLVESPLESLAKQNFKPARLLLGSNADEGNSWLIYMSELHHCSASQKPTTITQRQQHQQYQSSSSNNIASQQQDFTDILARQRAGRNAQWTDEQQAAETAATGDIQTSQEFEGKAAQIVTPTADSFKYAFCTPNEQTISRDTFYKLLQREEVNPHLKYPIAREAILFEYTNWINPNDSLASNDALDKIFGDYQFSCPVQDFALRYSSAGNPVFMYHYKHRSSISAWPKWMGVLHGDEINFIFGEPLNPAFNYTQQEVEFSRSLMRYWANFAKSG